MQTFLPYPSFEDSAAVLDLKRLGKQRVENLQIMKSLLMRRGWVNHPATKMWRSYEYALLLYQDAIVAEWQKHGYADTCMSQTLALFFKYREEGDADAPWWLGNEDLHISHQSNLIRKNPDHYGPLFPGVPDDLPYLWPV